MTSIEKDPDAENFPYRVRLATLVLVLVILTACIPIFVGGTFQTLKLVFKLNDALSAGEDRVVQIIVFPESVKVKRNFVQVSGKLEAPAGAQLPADIKVTAVIAAPDTGAVKQKIGLTLTLDPSGNFKGNKKIKKNIGAGQMMTVTLEPSGNDLAKGTEITLCVDLVKPKSKLGLLPACVEDESGGDPQESFAALQAEFYTPSCALSGCHSAGSASAGLVLASGQSFANVVNVPSSQQPSLNRVTPFDAENSYEIRKLRGDAGITGNRMPPLGEALTDEEIGRFVNWINDGALDN